MNIRELPAVATAVAQVVIAWLLTFAHWSPAQVGAAEGAVALAAGLIVAVRVHQPWVPRLAGLLHGLVVAAVAWRVPHLTPAVISGINSLLVMLTAYFTHTNVNPVRPGESQGQRGPATTGVPPGPALALSASLPEPAGPASSPCGAAAGPAGSFVCPDMDRPRRQGSPGWRGRCFRALRPPDGLGDA